MTANMKTYKFKIRQQVEDKEDDFMNFVLKKEAGENDNQTFMILPYHEELTIYDGYREYLVWFETDLGFPNEFLCYRLGRIWKSADEFLVSMTPC